MCVVSMVFDHYHPEFYKPIDVERDYAELARVIQEFREAHQAAKRVDILTKQPDCEDPEKAKLLDRIAELEAELAELKKETPIY